MKALTLHQPWASLVALGVKTIETRSWPCPPSLIGQALAIHAGANDPAEDTPLGDWYVIGSRTTGGRAQIIQNDRPVDEARCHVLPVGAVVGTCRVAACLPICEENEDAGPDHAVRLDLLGGAWHGDRNVSDQLPYGDFSPGRYAWLLEDVKPTTERCPACWGVGSWPPFTRQVCRVCEAHGYCPPVPARGRQRVWNWEPR